MIALYIATAITLIISAIVDIKKTEKALNIAIKRIFKIIPAFVKMLIIVSFILYFVPDEIIAEYLGDSSGIYGLFAGLSFGSITMMPGFIAFPLGGILLNKGVSYMNIAAFTTTLMLVGVITYPVEKEYLGSKITILRNVISFFIAVIITLAVGIIYGEVI